jgi:hypothetical protein
VVYKTPVKNSIKIIKNEVMYKSVAHCGLADHPVFRVTDIERLIRMMPIGMKAQLVVEGKYVIFYIPLKPEHV